MINNTRKNRKRGDQHTGCIVAAENAIEAETNQSGNENLPLSMARYDDDSLRSEPAQPLIFMCRRLRQSATSQFEKRLKIERFSDVVRRRPFKPSPDDVGPLLPT